MTHCGWNSTIEGVCSGLPMITWPLFAEQFLNEKFIVQVLKIGVRIGVEVPVRWGDEEKVGAMVKKSRIMEAIEMCMLGGEEEEKRRNRAIELGKMARNAIVKGGSSGKVTYRKKLKYLQAYFLCYPMQSLRMPRTQAHPWVFDLVT